MKRTFLVILAAACAIGCRPKVQPYDPADIRHSLEILAGRLFYEDAPLAMRRHHEAWCVSTGAGMRLPEGEYVYEYTLTPEAGAAVTYRQTIPFPGQWYGNILSLPGGPRRLPPGHYRLSLKAILPDGEVAKCNYVYDLTLRKRELRVTLTSDKHRYAAGETIRLTGTLVNLLDRPIRFSRAEKPTVMLRSRAGGDRMPLENAPLPGELAPGAACTLAELAFTAGTVDKRFKIGARSEWFPPPFCRTGTYELELSLRASIEQQGEGGAAAKPLFVEAIPGVVTLEVMPPQE